MNLPGWLEPESLERLPGGDTACVARAVTPGGPVLVKTGGLDGMFAAESAGLEWLGMHGLPVPAVLGWSQDWLILDWVGTHAPTPDAAQAFGRSLARLHNVELECFGSAPQAADGRKPVRGWVGRVPISYGSWDRFGDFYAEGRLLPTARLAAERGRLAPDDLADVGRLATALSRDPASGGPPQLPAPIHGDLWSGNLLWRRDSVVAIDPSAHGGHPLTDLAMLHLFGAPHLGVIMDAYERLRPLPRGWHRQLGLHQVFPLLVHAAMFGGGYGSRAAGAAREALR